MTQGTHAFPTCEAKGDWTDCSRFPACRTPKPARLVRQQKISRYDAAFSHTHTQTQRKSDRTDPPPRPHDPSAEQSSASPRQQSIDESTNQPIPSHHHRESLQSSSSRLRQGSAGLAVSRFDILPAPTPRHPTRQPTINTAVIDQLPPATDLLFSLSLYRELFRPGHVRALIASSYEPRALNARLEPL